jgi:N-acetylglucosamine-6-phosphate deacetylase
MQAVYLADRVFTGTEWIDDAAVRVKEGIIQQVGRAADEAGYSDSLRIEGWLVPAYIDAQVYGAAGRLFSQFPQPDTLQRMHEVFSAEGTCLFQPTLATNQPGVLRAAIDAVRQYWQQGGQGVHGLHLEGPWLNSKRAGAHVREWMHAPTEEEVQDLLDYGSEVITMVTLAPEICSEKVIRMLLERGIIVSAGHSDLDYEGACDAFDRGITAVTHLFNAMSPLHHRAPGLPGAVLMHERVCSSIIPDGLHVDYAMVKLAGRLMGSRLFAITDAVTETSEGPYRHQHAGNRFECNGTLSGSALSMHQAMTNLVQHGGFSLEEALRMCSLYPAKVLGIDHQYGRIAPLQAARMVVLTPGLELSGVL